MQIREGSRKQYYVFHSSLIESMFIDLSLLSTVRDVKKKENNGMNDLN